MLIIEILDWPWLTGIESIQNLIAADIMKLTASTEQHIRLPAEQVQLQASRKPRCYPVPCHPWPPSLPDEKTFIFQKSVRREQRLWILSPSLEEDMLMVTCHHLFAHSWGRLLSSPGFCHQGLYVSGVRAGIHWQCLCFQPWEMRLAQGSLPPSSWT